MTHKAKRPRSKERRRYYRIDDVVHLEYRILPPEEAEAIERQMRRPRPPEDGLVEQLASINKHMAALETDLRKAPPALAKYLRYLNKKVDLLAAHLALESADRYRKQGRHGTVVGMKRVNLSAGGVAFSIDRCLAPGTYLHVRMGVEETGFILNTYGRVIDCREREGEARAYRVRVEFPFLDEHERALLMRHIFDRQRAYIRAARKGKKG